MRELLVNGVKREVGPHVRTVVELLSALGYESRSIAVAVNRVCVRRQDFAATPVPDHAEVEILAPMAGG